MIIEAFIHSEIDNEVSELFIFCYCTCLTSIDESRHVLGGNKQVSLTAVASYKIVMFVSPFISP